MLFLLVFSLEFIVKLLQLFLNLLLLYSTRVLGKFDMRHGTDSTFTLCLGGIHQRYEWAVVNLNNYRLNWYFTRFQRWGFHAFRELHCWAHHYTWWLHSVLALWCSFCLRKTWSSHCKVYILWRLTNLERAAIDQSYWIVISLLLTQFLSNLQIILRLLIIIIVYLMLLVIVLLSSQNYLLIEISQVPLHIFYRKPFLAERGRSLHTIVVLLIRLSL